MPSQVTPVSATAVPGSLVVANPYILVDGVNIIMDEIDEYDYLPHILYWGVFKLEAQLGLLAEYELA